MTLKEIAIELLEKYAASEEALAWEYSCDTSSAEKRIEKEVRRYRKMINEADRKTEPQTERSE